MYIMDIRDELLKSKYENNKLYSEYSNAKTELIMLKKFYQENSPLKYSKQKFDAIYKDYELVKKEVHWLKEYNWNLKDEIKSLSASLLESNQGIIFM